MLQNTKKQHLMAYFSSMDKLTRDIALQSSQRLLSARGLACFRLAASSRHGASHLFRNYVATTLARGRPPLKKKEQQLFHASMSRCCSFSLG